jgi:predicted HAD superfamily Cof-like phosphohydrolase
VGNIGRPHELEGGGVIGIRPQEMLAEFHQSFGATDPELRPILHREEHDELIEALESGDRTAIARELADVLYIAYGTAHVYGINLDAAFAEVHRANMAKLVGGRPVYRADGKVLKPEGWRAPDMAVAL